MKEQEMFENIIVSFINRQCVALVAQGGVH